MQRKSHELLQKHYWNASMVFILIEDIEFWWKWITFRKIIRFLRWNRKFIRNDRWKMKMIHEFMNVEVKYTSYKVFNNDVTDTNGMKDKLRWNNDRDHHDKMRQSKTF